MIVDNHEKVAALIAEEFDGDTFWYTELLDRNNRTRGSNRVRIVRTFYHRSQTHFLDQWPTIKALCEAAKCRAYIRLSPRSFKAVGKLLAARAVEHALAEQWIAMPYLYASCCGKATPIKKLWLFDVDAPDSVDALALEQRLEERELLVTRMPSRKGYHLICKPHHVDYQHPGIELHKDNPTNLYVPEGAA